jgi:thioredoxin-like negative regulator of GroEL
MAYAQKGKEAKLSSEQKAQLEEEVGIYEKKAEKYHKNGDLVSAAGIYQMLSSYDPKRYGKLREKILKELDENGDTEGYAIVKGSGDKKEAFEYANKLYRAGRKEEAAYTFIAANRYKDARAIIAELSKNAKDEDAAKIAMRLLEGKKTKQQRIAAMHYEEQQAAQSQAA